MLQGEETCLQAPVFPSVGPHPSGGVSERDIYNNSPQSYRYPPPHLQRRASDSQQNLGEYIKYLINLILLNIILTSL